MGLHGAAAARAAIADGVEASQHGVLEESMVHVAAFVLGAQDIHCLILRYPVRSIRMMIDNKAGERLTHNQADIERQTRIISACPARALQCHDVVGIGQQNVLGML